MSLPRYIVGLILIAAALVSGARPSTAGDLPLHPILAYHDSWNEPAVMSAASTSFAALPGYVSIIALAFVRPDLRYSGDLDLSGTGLEYRYSGQILREAILLLKMRHPATRVLLSVGGATYDHWNALNESGISHLVRDLDADGIDLDFEPRRPGCTTGYDGRTRCLTDGTWNALVMRFRAVLPRPGLLTASVWSVGAFGEGLFRSALPISRYTGLMLNFLHSPQAAQIDMLSINAYDAGPQFDPIQAFQAYRSIWKGALALGLAVARNGGDGPFLTSAEAESLARQVARDPLGGMMVYPLLTLPGGPLSANRPDGRALAAAMCRGMALEGCPAPDP